MSLTFLVLPSTAGCIAPANPGEAESSLMPVAGSKTTIVLTPQWRLCRLNAIGAPSGP